MSASVRRCSNCLEAPALETLEFFITPCQPETHHICPSCVHLLGPAVKCQEHFCGSQFSKSDLKKAAGSRKDLENTFSSVSESLKCPVHSKSAQSVCRTALCPEAGRLMCEDCQTDGKHGKCNEKFTPSEFFVQAKPSILSEKHLLKSLELLDEVGFEVTGKEKLIAFAQQTISDSMRVPLKKELLGSLDIFRSKETGRILFRTTPTIELQNLIWVMDSNGVRGVRLSDFQMNLDITDKNRLISVGIRKTAPEIANLHNLNVENITKMKVYRDTFASEIGATEGVISNVVNNLDSAEGMLSRITSTISDIEETIRSITRDQKYVGKFHEELLDLGKRAMEVGKKQAWGPYDR